MKRNADSPNLDSHRNGPMSNAERQRRYRNRKRGGPPRGRWAGHISVAKQAEAVGASRSMLFMAKWICKHAPDLVSEIEAGTLKVYTSYYRRRDQMAMEIASQLDKTEGAVDER